MKTHITESTIESFTIELLKSLGYEYIYAPVIAPDASTNSAAGVDKRESYEQVLLLNRLRKAVKSINPDIPVDLQEDAIRQLMRISSPELIVDNEKFHGYLTEGIQVSRYIEGDERGERVWLVDFDNPYNNDFVVANQYTILENGQNKRPDVILFVNGIPLVVMELKNPASENASIQSAFRQIETYKTAIQSLFTYNAVVVISDGLEARTGSLSAGFTRFLAWKSADGLAEASHLVSQLETLVTGMLNKEILIDLVRHFIVFEKTKWEDPQTKVVTIKTVKKLRHTINIMP